MYIILALGNGKCAYGKCASFNILVIQSENKKYSFVTKVIYIGMFLII